MGSETFAMPEPFGYWCKFQDGSEDFLHKLPSHPDHGDVPTHALALHALNPQEIIARFLESTGQYVTNDASRDAAIRAAVLEALERARDVAFRKAAHVNSSWIANDIAEDIRQLAEQVKAMEFRRSGG